MGARKGRDFVRRLSQFPAYKLINPARSERESRIESYCCDYLYQKLKGFSKSAKRRVTRYGFVPKSELDKIDRGLFVNVLRYLPDFSQYYSNRFFRNSSQTNSKHL